MRHGNKNNHLGRKKAHIVSLMSNMANSLILNKKIETTVAKGKALKRYVEPLITKSKTDTTHSRRIVFSHLQNKETVTILFRDIAAKIGERKGGYTRLLKTGVRLGDKAEMCLLELVDYNEAMLAVQGKTTEKKAKTTRRGKKKAEPKAETNTDETKTDEPKGE